MISGASAYLLPHFSTEEVWKLVTEGGYTILNGVPSMFLAMVRKGEHYKDKAVSLKSGIIAGSSIIKRDYFEIMNRFPDMKLQPSYGQTETSPCVSIADPDDCLSDKATSCGKVIEDVSSQVGDVITDVSEKAIGVASDVVEHVTKASSETFNEAGKIANNKVYIIL